MKSIKSRLVVSVAVAAVLLTLSAAIGLDLLARSYLIRQFDADLLRKARLFASAIELEDDKLHVFDDLDLSDYATPESGGYLQVSLHNQTLYTSESLSGNALPLPEFDAGDELEEVDDAEGEDDIEDEDADEDAQEEDDFEDLRYSTHWIDLPEGRRGRGILLRVEPVIEEDPDLPDEEDLADAIDWPGKPGGEAVTLLLVRDSREINMALSTLRLSLAVIGTAMTVLMSLIAYLVVSRGMQPIDTLALRVSELDEQSLDQRIDLPDTPREIEPIITQFNALLNRLDLAFQRQRRFSADVAHETRTPLAGLRTTVEVALSKPRTPEQYAVCLEQLLGITLQMQSMVEALLKLSSLEEGRCTVEPKIIDINIALTRAWDCTVLGVIQNEAFTVSRSLQANTQIESDRNLLGLALKNILHNAVCYVNPGGTIHLETRNTDQGVEVCITNSGCTLNAHDAGRVFDRFWRGDASRTNTGSHFGLGLALTELAVKALDGSLKVKCDAGGKFAITIHLPASCL